MWYFFSVMEADPDSVNNVVLFFCYGDILTNPFNHCMQWNLKQKNHLPTTLNNVVLFSVMKTYLTSVKNVVIFSVMETDYSTPLITVCSETSIQQKYLPTTVNNVVLFFSYGENLLNTFNYCMQWKLNPTKKITTSVNNVVLFFSYGSRSHFSEQCGNFFQLWRHITQPL